MEAPWFTSDVAKYFEGDDGYRRFQAFLQENPEAGSVMRDCAGLRKVRWADPHRHAGKRGGLRVIYLYVPDLAHIYLVDIYSKGEKDDLTVEERKVLARLARQYKTDTMGKEQP